MTTAQRLVKPLMGHTRQCVHPDTIWCLMGRHQIAKKDKTFAQIMGGCDCPCHHVNGVPVPYRAWIAPGQREPIGTLHAIRLERIEETEEDEGWLL
jgi:hypothetical protein